MAAAFPGLRLASRPPLINPVTRGLATSADLCCASSRPRAARRLEPPSSHPMITTIRRALRAPTTRSDYAWSSAVPDILSLLSNPGQLVTKRSEILFYCGLAIASVDYSNADTRRYIVQQLMRLCLQHHKRFGPVFMNNVRSALLIALACDDTLCRDASVYELYEELFATPVFGEIGKLPKRYTESDSAMKMIFSRRIKHRTPLPPPVLELMLHRWARLLKTGKGQGVLSTELRPVLLQDVVRVSPFLSESKFAEYHAAVFTSIEADCRVFTHVPRNQLKSIPCSAIHSMVKVWCSVEPRRFIAGQDSLLSENLSLIVDCMYLHLICNGYSVSEATYQLVLDACWQCRDRRLGLQTYNYMRQQGIRPSVKAFGRIMRLSMASPVETKWLWEDLCKESKGCPPIGMFCYLMEALAFQSKDPTVIQHVHSLVVSRAQLLGEPYSQTLYSPSMLLWSFYAATLTGSVKHAFEQLDVMVSKGVVPDISVLTLAWWMVRSRQDSVEIVKSLSERMVRLRIEPSKEFILEGAAALGQLYDPLFWKSKLWNAGLLRTDLMSTALAAAGHDGEIGDAGCTATLQTEGEERLVTVLLAIFQQVNMEIASADHSFTGRVEEGGKSPPTTTTTTTTVSADDLQLAASFYLSSAARPGSNDDRLTDAMRGLVDASADGAGGAEPVFVDSSIESCLDTLLDLKTAYREANKDPLSQLSR